MWLQKVFGPNCALEIDKEFYSSIHYYGTADGTEVEGRNIYYAFRLRHNLSRPQNLKKISQLSLTLMSNFEKNWENFQIFVAFSEYSNSTQKKKKMIGIDEIEMKLRLLDIT